MPTRTLKPSPNSSINRFAILSAVIILGAFVRVIKLGAVPAGFFCDEASFGVNAYSIMTRGSDEFGTPYPLFFRSFGDYKEAIPTYSVVPFVYLFGLNEWSVRLMSVTYGLLNLILLYAIGTALRGPQVGVLTTFIGATMPWMFHYDRVAFHCSPYLTTLLCAIFFLITARSHNPLRICGFFIFSGLSLYTYSPSKLMAPLLILSALCIYWRYFKTHRLLLILGVTIFVIIATPLLKAISSGEALARAEQLNLLDTSNLSFKTLSTWLRNYEAQLLPSSLFAQGEFTLIKRHLTNFFPPLLITTAPFLFVGIMRLLREATRPEYAFLLVSFALFPLGATFTGTPFTHRSVLGAPLCALCIALGFESIVSGTVKLGRLRSSVVKCFCLLCIIANAAFYLNRYLTEYPLQSSDFNGWQYGPREIIAYFRQHSSEYDELILHGEFNAPEIFFKFYASDGLCLSRCSVGDFSLYNPDKRQLFATTPTVVAAMEKRYLFTHRDSVMYPNGETAFLLGTVIPVSDPPPIGS